MFDTRDLVESIEPGDRLAAALALINAQLDTDPGDQCDQAVTDELLASLELAERAKALAMTRAAVWEPRRTWQGSAARTARSWLNATTDLGSDGASQLLRCGRLVAGHEMVAKHLRSGDLSCRKVEAIGQVATRARAVLFARDEHTLLRAISALSAGHADRVLARWRALCDDALANDDSNQQHERRRFHHSRAGNAWHQSGQCDLDDGAIIDAALRDAMGDPDPADRPGGARTTEQRRADALAKICGHWNNHRNHGHGSNPVATVNLHINDHTLAGSSAHGFDPEAICDLVPGGPIPRDSARLLLCDSYLARIVLNAKGEPTDLGRTQRLFSPAQKRGMVARDGPHCVVPSCTEPVEHCDAHHLDPYEPVGQTNLANGGHVCRGHHRDIHKRGYTLARGPDGWTYTAPDGTTWTT